MLQTAHFKRCIQTLDASFALLKRATPGSVEYEVYRNATIKGFELVLETGGKLLGKYLPLRWTGSTSRIYCAMRPNMAYSRPMRSNAGSPIGTTETLRPTIMGKHWRKRR